MGSAAREASTRYAIERTTTSMIALYEKVVEDAYLFHEDHEMTLRKLLDRILAND